MTDKEVWNHLFDYFIRNRQYINTSELLNYISGLSEETKENIIATFVHSIHKEYISK